MNFNKLYLETESYIYIYIHICAQKCIYPEKDNRFKHSTSQRMKLPDGHPLKSVVG